MIARIKDITGEKYKFIGTSKVLENMGQVIVRGEDGSEAIFNKDKIIYAVRECEPTCDGCKTDDRDTTNELIEYFDEKLAEESAIVNKDILVMYFKHSEINLILSALHHYLDSDDCK